MDYIKTLDPSSGNTIEVTKVAEGYYYVSDYDPTTGAFQISTITGTPSIQPELSISNSQSGSGEDESYEILDELVKDANNPALDAAYAQFKADDEQRKALTSSGADDNDDGDVSEFIPTDIIFTSEEEAIEYLD